MDTLEGKGPFTVFAPTNGAFDALPKGVLANLLKPENKKRLVDLLTFHVVAGEVHRKDILDAERLRTVEGMCITHTTTADCSHSLAHTFTLILTQITQSIIIPASSSLLHSPSPYPYPYPHPRYVHHGRGKLLWCFSEQRSSDHCRH